MDRRELTTDLELLKILQDSGGYLMPESIVLTQAKLAIVPPPFRSDVEKRLRYLDSKGRARPHETETGRKWALTDAGRAFLEEYDA